MKIEQLRETGLQLSDFQLKQFDTYAEVLIEWNEKMNLTAIREYGDIVEKHFYDCLLPLQKCSLHGKTADVGSGAGFPGLVWKIACPDIELSLIEPTGKRCRFLEEVVKELSLDHVHIYNERAEEHVRKHRESYDFVTARAVADLRVLSELTIPLVKVNGYFIAMKGMKGEVEAEEAGHALEILGASIESVQKAVLPEGDQRMNLFIHKDSSTPPAYPRNYGQIKKKPL